MSVEVLSRPGEEFSMYYDQWKPYVPVARRRQQATRRMETLRNQGVDIRPVVIAGRKIAKTFWGEAWCDHLESFSDFDNRLPRGRTYVRNGSVCHLAIKKGQVEGKVSGSDIYDIKIEIKTLPAKKWRAVKRQCSGQIGSLLELLRGDLSDNIMQVVTDREKGLFPLPDEISFTCDCPDWAIMCKHVAAVLYGVGARLDQDPSLLFQLRGVDHDELIDVDAQVVVPTATRRGGAKRIASDDLGDVFGIDLATDEPATPRRVARKAKAKVKKAPAAKKPPSTQKASPAKRSAKKGTKKVAVRKKKAKKVVKKTTARKPTKKKSVEKKLSTVPVKHTTAGKSPKKKATKKKAVSKKAVKKTPVRKKKVTKASRKRARPDPRTR